MPKIVNRKGVLGGKPIIEGTRISVDLIMSYLANDLTIEDIQRDFPHLTDDEIKAALDHAEKNIRRERVKLEPSTS